MNAIAGALAGILLAVAIGRAAGLDSDVTGLFGGALCLFGTVLGRIADRLAPRG
jgi:hypothetical protein